MSNEQNQPTLEAQLAAAKKLLAEGLKAKPETIDAFLKKPDDTAGLTNEIVNNLLPTFQARHQAEWEAQFSEKTKKESQIGTYNAIGARLLKEFGLDAKQFEHLQTGRVDEMIKHLKEEFTKLKATPPPTGADAAAVTQYQQQLKAANDQLEQLKALEASVPQKIEAEVDKVHSQYFLADAMRSALASIKNLDPRIDLETINSIVAQRAQIQSVKSPAGGRIIQILDKVDGKPIKKSATANFESLAEFITAIATEKNWLLGQNPGGGNGGGAGGGNGAPTLKSNRIPVGTYTVK